ncbi:peptidase inhibitor family I36 [Stackebrandtia albiflava]|uniref:Peptidase inhibitor family I36 n=1 Tax=Stackebrandtia albiflava TaxID=406432 RepID=A0A562V2J5_9ACTN|nr:peptidase inhibitor family I36 protein [Stackebrandtia albiflava]TWJ12119.1 peptidase inhibitor family I36 [Stackebrandtia albiflava]
MRIIGTGVAVGLLAAAAMAGSAAATPTEPEQLGSCPLGAVCFYTEPYFQGEVEIAPGPSSPCQATGLSEGIASVANNLSRPVLVFEDEYCESTPVLVPPHGNHPVVQPPGLSWG